jgi:hypothetical protein
VIQQTSVLINERDFVLMLIDSMSAPTRSEPREETMSTEQEQWSAQIREIPTVFRGALLLSDNSAIRHRPAASEWSAVEVLGHMIDKMQIWTSRVKRLMAEERPALPAYDQEALVREHDYQHADPDVLFEQLRQACERFATLVERVPNSALQREGVHEEVGPVTLRQCIEVPLESATEHLEQLRAAQTLV